MPGTYLTDELIITVLREAQAGAKTADLCRRYGASERAFYRWKVRFRSVLRWIQEVEDENTRLKRLVAELTLSNQALRKDRRKAHSAAGDGPGVGPKAQREAARALMTVISSRASSS
jgi:putative transposase